MSDQCCIVSKYYTIYLYIYRTSASSQAAQLCLLLAGNFCWVRLSAATPAFLEMSYGAKCYAAVAFLRREELQRKIAVLASWIVMRRDGPEIF